MIAQLRLDITGDFVSGILLVRFVVELLDIPLSRSSKLFGGLSLLTGVIYIKSKEFLHVIDLLLLNGFKLGDFLALLGAQVYDFSLVGSLGS